MGRWAQRRHGGSAEGADLYMVSVTVDTGFDPTIAIVTYNRPVTGNVPAFPDYLTTPNGYSASSVIQSGGDTLQVQFGDTLITETTLTYQGTQPRYLTPQTLGITVI